MSGSGEQAGEEVDDERFFFLFTFFFSIFMILLNGKKSIATSVHTPKKNKHKKINTTL